MHELKRLFSSHGRGRRLVGVWPGIIFRRASRPRGISRRDLGVLSISFLFFFTRSLAVDALSFYLLSLSPKTRRIRNPYKIVCNYAPLFRPSEWPRPASSSSSLLSLLFLRRLHFFTRATARRLPLVDWDSSSYAPLLSSSPIARACHYAKACETVPLISQRSIWLSWRNKCIIKSWFLTFERLENIYLRKGLLSPGFTLD